MPLGDYIRETWQNAVTPINATRLNNLETGLDAVTDSVRLSTVDTVAALRATTASAGDTLRVLGYHSAGDKAGIRFYRVLSASSLVDNGGTVITPTGATTPGIRYQLIGDPRHLRALDFGLRADGTAGDEVYIQAAVNALPTGGGTVELPAGDINMDAQVIVTKSGTRIKGQGFSTNIDATGVVQGTETSTAPPYSRTADYLRSIFAFRGTIARATTTLSASAAVKSRTITLTSATGFTAGNMVFIRSNQGWTTDFGPNAYKGEIQEVDSVSTNVVTVREWLREAYTLPAETVTIDRVTPIEYCSIEDMRILGAGDGSGQVAAEFKLSRDCYAKNVKIDNCSYVGIAVVGSMHFRAENCQVERARETILNFSRTGRGIAFYGSYKCQAVNCTGRDNWHSFEGTGNDPWPIGRAYVFTGCTSSDGNGYAFSTHEGCDGVTFSDCIAHNITWTADEPGGFILRGKNNAIFNCKAINVGQSGLYVGSTGSKNINVGGIGLQVNGFECDTPTNAGIAIVGRIERAVLSNIRIRNAGTGGIRITTYSAYGLKLTNFDIESSSAEGISIKLDSNLTDTGLRGDRITIADGSITGCGQQGIRFENEATTEATNYFGYLTVHDVDVINNTGKGIDGSTSYFSVAKIHDCTVLGNGTSQIDIAAGRMVNGRTLLTHDNVTV